MHSAFLGKAQLPFIPQLPDPFLRPDGSRIQSREEWAAQREYLKDMAAHYLYGHLPAPPDTAQGEVLSAELVYDGKAIRETVRITAGEAEPLSFEAIILRPVDRKNIPSITWNQFSTHPQDCPMEEEAVREKGYAIISFAKEQLAPDAPGPDGGFDAGAFGRAYPGYDARALAIWGFGHSLITSYLFTTDWANTEQIAATGFSRGGKAALCAGIFDERIAVCMPNASGCGGLGSYRYLGGRLGEGIGSCEAIENITDRFWFWLADALKEFGGKSEGYALPDAFRLPLDAHTARALIAPRAVFDAECLDDTWCNGFGTQVAWRAAQEVYAFLGEPRKNAIFFSDGGHHFGIEAWRAMIDFLEVTFFGKEKREPFRYFDEKESPVPPLHYHWRAPR